MSNYDLMKATSFRQRIIDYIDAMINNKKEKFKDIFAIGIVAQFIGDCHISDLSHFIHVDISEEVFQRLKSQNNEEFGRSHLSGSFINMNNWHFQASINRDYELKFELVIKELMYIDGSNTAPLRESTDVMKDLKIKKKLYELETYLKVQKWQEIHSIDEGFEAIEKERNRSKEVPNSNYRMSYAIKDPNDPWNIGSVAEIADMSMMSSQGGISQISDMLSINSATIKRLMDNKSPIKGLVSPIRTKTVSRQLSQNENTQDMVDEILKRFEQQEGNKNVSDVDQNQLIVINSGEIICTNKKQEENQKAQVVIKKRNFEEFLEHQNGLEQEKITKLNKESKISYLTKQETFKTSREVRDIMNKKYEKNDLIHHFASNIADFSFAHESEEESQHGDVPLISYQSIKGAKPQHSSNIIVEFKETKFPDEQHKIKAHFKNQSNIDLPKFPYISEIRKDLKAKTIEITPSSNEVLIISDDENFNYPSISCILRKKTDNNLPNKKISVAEITGCIPLNLLQEILGKNKFNK